MRQRTVTSTPVVQTSAEDTNQKDVTFSASFMHEARLNEYNNMLPVTWTSLATNSVTVFALFSFLATPWGAWWVFFCVQCCSGFMSLDFVLKSPYLSILISGLITSFFSISTFILLARYWDTLYEDNPEKRCQQEKTHDTSGMLRRSEVRLAMVCLTFAAFLSSLVVVAKVTWGYGKMYTDISDYGYCYLVFSTVAYFVWIDLWAYFAHRALHFPFLYKHFHKWHHAYKQPTAFTGLALHPVDMMLIQGGVYSAFYIMPLHMSAIAFNLLYVHFYNVVDHSGVYKESPLPWQPSSLYHDDHHRLFHVNYGQFLTIWDRVFGTFYKQKKRYGEDCFSY